MTSFAGDADHSRLRAVLIRIDDRFLLSRRQGFWTGDVDICKDFILRAHDHRIWPPLHRVAVAVTFGRVETGVHGVRIIGGRGHDALIMPVSSFREPVVVVTRATGRIRETAENADGAVDLSRSQASDDQQDECDDIAALGHLRTCSRFFRSKTDFDRFLENAFVMNRLVKQDATTLLGSTQAD